MSNAVNLTDGLMVGRRLVYSGVSAHLQSFIWAFRHPEIYELDHALDLAVAVSMLEPV